MSYIRAEDVLPKELIETIQQYVDGKSIYIPCKEKHEWGSNSSARRFFEERNLKIFTAHQKGTSVTELAHDFSLSEKSIKRILREQSQIDS